MVEKLCSVKFRNVIKGETPTEKIHAKSKGANSVASSEFKHRRFEFDAPLNKNNFNAVKFVSIKVSLKKRYKRDP